VEYELDVICIFAAWMALVLGVEFKVWRRRVLRPLSEITWLIEHNPHEAQHYFNRGELYLSFTRENELAAADFTKVIELEAGRWLAYAKRGQARAGESQFDGAIADFTQAIALAAEADALSPKEWWLYRDRAEAHQASGDHPRAIDDASEAIRCLEQCDEFAKSDVAKLLYLRAMSHRAAGNRTAAEEDFAAAHRYDPWWVHDPRPFYGNFWQCYVPWALMAAAGAVYVFWL
jgi:tetratricopeptide (TPR) repeat protein